jgi:hypothetical protein
MMLSLGLEDKIRCGAFTFGFFQDFRPILMTYIGVDSSTQSLTVCEVLILKKDKGKPVL